MRVKRGSYFSTTRLIACCKSVKLSGIFRYISEMSGKPYSGICTSEPARVLKIRFRLSIMERTRRCPCPTCSTGVPSAKLPVIISNKPSLCTIGYLPAKLFSQTSENIRYYRSGYSSNQRTALPPCIMARGNYHLLKLADARAEARCKTAIFGRKCRAQTNYFPLKSVFYPSAKRFGRFYNFPLEPLFGKQYNQVAR